MTALVLEQAVAAMRDVLAGVYAEPEAAEERARNIVQGLIGAPHPDAFAGVRYSISLRPFRDPWSGTVVDVLAVRCLTAWIMATFRQAPSRLELFAALRRLGAPEQWIFSAGETLAAGEVAS